MKGMLVMAAYGLKDYYNSADDIVKTVIDHGIAAASAAALSGCIPGTGGAVAAAVSIGIILKMYISLGKLLGIYFGNGVLKALASAIVADLAGSVTAILAVSAVISFFPGIGTLGAATITGITSFCYVYLAGLIYIQMVGKILKGGKPIENLSEEDLKVMAKQVANDLNMKDAVEEARKAYKNNKR